ncbi:MAG: flagellar export protein FliJ [Planctomycetota bacterium]
MNRRWDSVQAWRNRQRDEASIEVGKARQAIQTIDDQIEKLHNEIQNTVIASSARTGSVSVDRLLGEGRYRFQIEAQIGDLRETRARLESELERRREILLASQFEVKRIERLAEKQKSEDDLKRRQRELAETDEAAARTHLIRTRTQNIQR